MDTYRACDPLIITYWNVFEEYDEAQVTPMWYVPQMSHFVTVAKYHNWQYLSTGSWNDDQMTIH